MNNDIIQQKLNEFFNSKLNCLSNEEQKYWIPKPETNFHILNCFNYYSFTFNALGMGGHSHPCMILKLTNFDLIIPIQSENDHFNHNLEQVSYKIYANEKPKKFDKYHNFYLLKNNSYAMVHNLILAKYENNQSIIWKSLDKNSYLARFTPFTPNYIIWLL